MGIHRGKIRALGAGHDVSKDHQIRCGLSRNPDAHTTWTFKPLTVYTVMASSPLRTAMSHLADSERESRNRVQGFYNLFHCVESFSQPCPAPLACVARLNDGRPACMPLCFLVVPSRGWALSGCGHRELSLTKSYSLFTGALMLPRMASLG